MNFGQTVFSQLFEHLPHKEFQKCVARYRGDHYLKSFSCWDQFLAMGFAQLTYRESLRDIGRYSHPVDRSSGVRSDHTVVLTASESAKVYPDALRRVTLFEKMPILRALEAIDSQNELGGDPNQLILFEF